MPFISELMLTADVLPEYVGTKFEASFSSIITDRKYEHIRRLRRDGNCFYRAFLFQLFEHYALVLGDAKGGNVEQYKKNYAELVNKIETQAMDDMTKEGGYDAIVVEDFQQVFLEQLKKLADLKADFDK